METYSRSTHWIIKLVGVSLIGVMVCLGTIARGQWAIDPGQRWETLNERAKQASQGGDYANGSTLEKQAYDLARQAFGERDPRILISLNNLAMLYWRQGRYSEAEPLLKEALPLSREVLDPRHLNTLQSLNNLAMLYQSQGRYGEAEPLYKEALQLSREVLGPHYPAALQSLNNLATLYEDQGRYGEAEPLLKEALQRRREVLGPRHPDTLSVSLDSVFPLVNLNRRSEAIQRLRELEPPLLDWIGTELYSTQAEQVRRQLVASQSSFQNDALSLALQEQNTAARQLAGIVMLRWKQVQGEEEAYLARLVRRSEDQRVRNLAQEIATQRDQLAKLIRAGKPDEATQVLTELEAKELQLGQVSRDYKDHLRVRTANLEDVRAALPPGTGLVEFRQYQPVDFRAGKGGEPHWVALLLIGFEEPVLADLGPVAVTRAPLETLLDESTPAAEKEKAAQALYQTLFGPLDTRLAPLQTVYLAPDGPLNLVPFSRLKLPDGRYWEQRQTLRLLQTGRDLLRPEPDRPARGLLALGGIDFDAQGMSTDSKAAKPDTVEAVTVATATQALLGPRSDAAWQDARNLTRSTLRDGFGPLPASQQEIDNVKEAYQKLRRDEAVDLWPGAQASESRLKALSRPPRGLHLATHGFYLPDDGQVQRPMLLSGIALAGANRALTNPGEDGILYSLEAQGLNLEGSELVVLSACDTARGSVDYGEGVYGLVRALRIAGARQALVTLWKLNDGEARDFMTAFYKTWLSQERSDPAAALHQVRLSYINDPDPKRHDPRVWAPYILVGQ
ncbi:MAG TPA: CHAT domain-containing tetratricopeptide repeat protein [Candidatus Competibacteraceae bacterium]|nr:CHAT domain-containing tetratricopeptide repeat protein [Candidatus Competibacteraceae bacterium]